MKNTAKALILLIVLGIIVILTGIGIRTWLSNQRQPDAELSEEAGTELSPDIPEEMSDVAEEEYAIEFEAAEPTDAIDMQFCDFVKSQCEEQGVKDCEDYKMCVEGIKSNKE